MDIYGIVTPGCLMEDMDMVYWLIFTATEDIAEKNGSIPDVEIMQTGVVLM